MNKPTLEQLCPYLPYGLKSVQQANNFGIKQLISNVILSNVTNFTDSDYEGKVILRPMDLITPIRVDGNKIIPLQEISKRFLPLLKWDKPLPNEWIGNEIGRFFTYNRMTSGFEYWEQLEYLPVHDQYRLFQWLFKNKFDVFGGIGSWAVNSNTLKTNPYE